MGLDMFIECFKDGEIKSTHYLRKAYLIMDWFENLKGFIGNLEEYEIDVDELELLKGFCAKVIEDGDFTEVKKMKGVWTTVHPLEQDSDYHMSTVVRTKDFLDSIDFKDYDSFRFYAWW